MLKCLMKYEWVKLRRNTLPVGTEQRIVAVLAWVLHSEMLLSLILMAVPP